MYESYYQDYLTFCHQGNNEFHSQTHTNIRNIFYRWKDGEVIAPNPELVISILGKKNIDKIHIIMKEGRVHNSVISVQIHLVF